MTNHDCQKRHLKPFEDGEVCVICGNFFGLPLPEDQPVAAEMKKAQSAIQGEAVIKERAGKIGRKKAAYGASQHKPYQSVGVVELGQGYVQKVFEQIEVLLADGTSWQHISWLLSPRAFLKKTVNLKKYYLQEKQRREFAQREAA